MSEEKLSENVRKEREQPEGELLEEGESLKENPKDVDEELDLDEELGLEEDREKVSLWNALTYGVVIVLVVLLCTLVWVATHRNRGGDVPADAESTVSTDAGNLPAQGASLENVSQENVPLESISPENVPQETTVPTSVVSGEGSGQESQGPTDGSTPMEETESVTDPVSGDASMAFREVSETVTAKDVTNLRSEPNTTDAENVLTQLMNGNTLTRTGINEDTGWSRLLWNDQEVYAVTQYLTTDLSYRPPVAQGDPNRVTTMDGRVIIFVDCDDTITPKEYVNLRVEPSTSQGESTVRTQLQGGEQAHRTGYSPDAGWSRVEYNGEVLYVVSSYVLTVQ